jgi:hypothetical protein
MENSAYDEVLHVIQSWSISDQLKLIEALARSIREQVDPKPRYDVREFRGIARGMWDDVGGVDEFIKQERASWDD